MPRCTAFFTGAITAAILAAPVGAVAQAGLVVQQHTTFNVAKLSSADLQQTMSILGADRARTVTTGKTKILIISVDASGTEITRLDRDSIIRLDDKKKTYTIKSLADTRAELLKQQKDVEKSAESQEKDGTRSYAVVDEARRTGEKQVINGFSTEQLLVKLTIYNEDTKTGVKTVTNHLTADVWFDPSLAEAARVMAAYRAAQQKALGVEPTMAANPYARWLSNVDGEMARISGYPIRSTITYEGVAAPAAPAEAKAEDKPPTSIGGAIGGMFGKKKSDPPPVGPYGGPILFTASTEVLKLVTTPPAPTEFEIPAGYVKK
jgi:hypothetical protein